MDYNALKEEYDRYLEEKAAAQSVSVEEYLSMLVNTSAVKQHTIELAEMIKGYIESGELNLKLSQEGLVDIDGDTAW